MSIWLESIEERDRAYLTTKIKPKAPKVSHEQKFEKISLHCTVVLVNSGKSLLLDWVWKIVTVGLE